MPTRTLHHFVLAASAAIYPSLACASPQDHRPDSEAYPCNLASQLAVTQDPQGFVIRARQPAPVKTVASKPAEIAIGASLKFDLAILSRTVKHREADNAVLR